MKVCEVKGCDKRQSARGWCGTHYGTWLRNGDPTKRLRHWSTGQCQIDAVGEGPQPCYWCGKALRWQADYRRDADYLVVDHLDNDPGNNAIENLAPSCQPCNTTHSYVITRTRERRPA